jgi:hypothetical protein
MPVLTASSSDDFDADAATRAYRTRYRGALASTPALGKAVLARAGGAFREVLANAARTIKP